MKPAHYLAVCSLCFSLIAAYLDSKLGWLVAGMLIGVLLAAAVFYQGEISEANYLEHLKDEEK